MPDLAQLQADRDAVYAAKIQFLQKGAVKEVMRAGRRLVFANASLADYDTALAKLDSEIDGLSATCEGRRRRRAISLSFG